MSNPYCNSCCLGREKCLCCSTELNDEAAKTAHQKHVSFFIFIFLLGRDRHGKASVPHSCWACALPPSSAAQTFCCGEHDSFWHCHSRTDFTQRVLPKQRHEYGRLKPSSVISPDGSRRFTVAFSTSFLLTPLLSSGTETLSQVSAVLHGFYSETEQSTMHAVTLVRIKIKD